ncbi:hypothetical protein FA13DRAFT_1860300 [Coprinellus micaceus]|uniref:Uncharacterized protein n=1 Tax=Coprinellus micaceus TaxID=71717 RepID=A0A4Y7SCA7_COPMI|nr:hypothetical protein FA13DRAFT_1860300 [Coprinellus micaceus]
MNRLAIECLLASHGISDAATGGCRVVLTDGVSKESPDTLTALLHSVHIKEIRYLEIRYMSYFSSHSLVKPLRRTHRLLSRLESVASVTLHFPAHFGGEDGSTTEKYLRKTVLLFEEVLNEIIFKSCKRLYLHGSRNLLENMYRFRTDEGTSFAPSRKTFLRHLVGAKDYFDRRKEKKVSDPIVQDDLRYARTTITGSRVLARCSQSALTRTQLAHINMNTVDFLRPPFSQWLFAMLRASPVTSLSFDFHTSPRLRSQSQEHEFMLIRLAAVLPHLQSLHVTGLTDSSLHPFAKFMNKFPNLTNLIVESPKHEMTFATFASVTPPSIVPETHANRTPFAFTHVLRQIDGPVHLITWFFRVACQFQQHRPESSDPANRDRMALPPRFPSLLAVRIDFYCVRGVRFDLSILADAIRAIHQSLKPSSDSPTSPRRSNVTIEVHLKFDQKFGGLRLSWSRGVAGIPKLVHTLSPDIVALNDDLTALGRIGKVFLVLPGSRGDILEGRFNAKIFGVLTIFSKLRYLRLLSAGSRVEVPTILSGSHLGLFTARNPGLKRVEVQ